MQAAQTASAFAAFQLRNMHHWAKQTTEAKPDPHASSPQATTCQWGDVGCVEENKIMRPEWARLAASSECIWTLFWSETAISLN
jgi:hypothetical protein